MAFPIARLRRFPDAAVPNLFAFDATDRLLLEETTNIRRSTNPGRLVIIGDRYGALTLGSLWEEPSAHDFLRDLGTPGAPDRNQLESTTSSTPNNGIMRVHQDSLSGEYALLRNAAKLNIDKARFTSLPLGAPLLEGAELVLLQLPRGLDALDEVASHIARYAPQAQVYAGGRLKHMTLAMNKVLGRYFDTITPSRARQKSRLLVASGTNPENAAKARPYPRVAFDPPLGLEIAAHGATFGGTKVDAGTRLLLSTITEDVISNIMGTTPPDSSRRPRIIDLGCGNGVIACAVAKRAPEAEIIATDSSTSAVLSAQETVKLNGLTEQVSVVRDHALDSQADDSADLILLNPPFHVGAAVHTEVAQQLFAAAARVLRPGGELYVVFNSYLQYQYALGTIVGSTKQVTRDKQFTVTRSQPD